MSRKHVTESGREFTVPDHVGENLCGLDPEGRIVIDNFDALNQPYSEHWMTRPFLFGLTLCCNASDKGVEDGVVCRACYGEESGSYLYMQSNGTFPGLDRVKVTA